MEKKAKENEPVTIIGEATAIAGILAGDENLTVHGRIDGSINLSKLLTIESTGVVRAEIKVREAYILGVLEGNLEAEELVHITSEGRMIGDIKAPRVILVDGARFKGNIDMGTKED
ncbi:MAG: polymer-forming cytoskeletal protein [Deltaproteobacteria bacterium]|nr:polymer-forming cytoskeletal protein [Deltaproteobacteria bacterium]